MLKELLQGCNNIVFFGGAGVSTESGIPDFRSSEGLYNTSFGKYYPEEILSHDFFYSHPREFYKFYREKMIYKDACPNIAHITLAKLEKQGSLKAVITQNIDGLHQKAGSSNVIELHGSVHRNICISCGKEYALEKIFEDELPLCSCKGVIKPDVVLYGEQLYTKNINDAARYIANADILIAAGSSFSVYPAAGFLDNYTGTLVIINKTSTEKDNLANYIIRDSVGKVLSEVL